MPKAKPTIVGLTGSIAMGKSTAAKMFMDLGVPVFCADHVAHDFLREDKKGIDKIIKIFPQSFWAGRISRKRLGSLVFGNQQKTEQLESILHPFIQQKMKAFIKQHQQEKLILLDIPLLFEGGWERFCDITICVTAPKDIQKERALKRKNMTASKLKAILARQMSDKIKRQKADIIISSVKSKKEMRQQIKSIWEELNA